MNLRDRLLAPIGRLTAALCDPQRRERTVVAVLIGYALIWTLYGALAKGSQGVHFDMAELTAWSQHPAWGYVKHPPLAAWVVGAWFTVFPRTDWAFYLLSMSSVALALWIAWCIAGRYLDGEKRVLALAMLTLIPLLNFHPLKFNANTILIPLWALTTLWFIRSIENRKALGAALAGLAGAAAMLGKYWSVFLLAGLALAALVHPRRGAYLRSAAPWITAAVGALALAPHVAWLVANDFRPFGYAMAVHGGESLAGAAKSVGTYLIGSIAYTALPVAAALLAVRWSRAAVADMLAPASGERRFVAVAFWAPLLLPIAVALSAGSEIISLWTMSAWTLLPIFLLSPPALAVSRQAATGAVALALVMPIGATLAAPLIAYTIHRKSDPGPGVYYAVTAKAVDRAWRAATTQPLRYVGGEWDLVYGAAFYLPAATAFPDFNRELAPWIDEAAVARDGIALVCKAEDQSCVQRIRAYAANQTFFRVDEVTLANRFLGSDSVAKRFLIVIVPPRNTLAGAAQSPHDRTAVASAFVVDHVERPLLHFHEQAAEIFSDDAERNKLNAAKK